MLPYSFAQTAKFWVALAGTIVTVALGVVDPSWEVGGVNVGQALVYVSGALTALSTFLVKNAPTEDGAEPVEPVDVEGSSH